MENNTILPSVGPFLIATGTKTYRPDSVPFNGSNIMDSDEFLEMAKIPRSLVVVGAGVIGVEYATMFSALDVRVTLIEPRDSFLDFIDKTLIQDFTHQIRENGVDLRRFPAAEWPEAPGRDRPLRVTFVGRLIPVKGVPMLLDAVARLRDEFPLEVKIVGARLEASSPVMA